MFRNRNRLFLALVLTALVALFAFTGAAVAAPLNGAAAGFGAKAAVVPAGFNSAHVPDELLVKFKPVAVDENALHRQTGAVAVEKNEVLGLARVRLAPGSDLDKAMAVYRSSAAVQYVQPNYIYHAFFIPNDTYYSLQWNMPKISAEQAWDFTMGSPGVVVAVVDTGVELSHPDLAANLVTGYNFISPGTPPMDDFGHGTHVAGIVAAVTNNGAGVAGVAGGCRIMPVKVLDANGSGDDFGVAQGIQWAADHGARVINMSLGGPDYSQALADAVNYAHGKNVLIVAAAGNDGKNGVSYPAALPHVMAVGATDSGDILASFSNYGSALDLVAPGVNIASTYADNIPPYYSYAYLSGTSMATPHVAGAAALVLSLHPGYMADQVESALDSSAVDLGDHGWDPYYGYGRLNVLGALEGGPPPGGITVCGTVYLEGRTDCSGAVVSVVGTTYQATTGPDGSFALSGVPAGTYDLRAGKHGYLYRARQGIVVLDGAVTDVAPMLLLAGDFTGDNIVDIDDLQLLRYTYGSKVGDANWIPVVDVNNDGKIGLFDLVYMARNYAMQGD